MTSPLDAISGEDARSILFYLSATYPEMTKVILAKAEELLKDFDCEGIAHEVSCDLEMLELEDLWNCSGPSRYGYTSPEDMAVEMFEEALESFEKQIVQYEGLGMHEEAKRYCMGVLLGIYLFDHASESEFKDYTPDIPRGHFLWLHEKWKKRNPSDDAKKDMDDFISRKCPEWA